MKRVGKMIAFTVCVAVCVGALSGCGEGTANVSKAQNNLDPYGKYDQEVTVRVVKSLSGTEKFKEGEDIANNVWTRLYKDQFNVKTEFMWTVPENQYEQKMNVSIASGDLPDIFSVPAKQFKSLVASGKVQEIGSYYEQTANENTKKAIDSEKSVLSCGTIDGKLMGLADIASPIDAADLLWLRTDWMKKLGVEQVTNTDELDELLIAFAQNDPDGNGEKDTYGLAVSKELTGGVAGLQGYMACHHAYMDMWVADESGELVYGSIQPEMKNALLALQKLYQAGAIDPEFGVKDRNKVAENISAGKIGCTIGAMWCPNWPFNSLKELQPDSDWQPFGLVSCDDQPAKTMVNAAPTTYTVVNAEFQYPELLYKMLNLYADYYLYPETQEEYQTYAHSTDGTTPYKYVPIGIGRPMKNIEAYRLICEALETGDESKITPDVMGGYQSTKRYLEGDMSAWSNYMVSGPNGAFSVIDNEYVQQDRILYNMFTDVPTETMVNKMSTLNTMEAEVFTKIILGEDISSFDTFVEDWNSLGGEQITKEVNEWYRERNE